MNMTMHFLTALSPVAAFLFKVTLLLGLAWTLHAMLWKRNPRWRVLVWRLTMAGLLLLPVVQWASPALTVSVPAAETTVVQTAQIADKEVVVRDRNTVLAQEPAMYTPVPTSRISGSVPTFHLRDYFGVVSGVTWALVSLVLLLRAAAAAWGVRRFVAATAPAPKSLRDLMANVADRIGCRRRPELRVTAHMTSPFLSGYLRPVIVIPKRVTDADHADDLPGVLAHELAHVATRDPFWMSLATVLSSALWFHPIMWRLRGAHASACESVCDAMAANASGDGVYSRTLARIALALHDARPVSGGVAMLRTPEISKRLKRLKEGIRVVRLSRRLVIAAVFAGCIALAAIGALRIVQAAPAESESQSEASQSVVVEQRTVSVKVVDEVGHPIEGATITPDGLRTKIDPGSHYGWVYFTDQWGKPEPATTNAEGIAEVAYPRYARERHETGAISFSVTHPDYVAVRPTSYSVNGTEAPVVLTRGATVRLTAVFTDGTPVAGPIQPIPRVSMNVASLLDRDAWTMSAEGTLEAKRYPAGTSHVMLVYLSDNGPTQFSDAVTMEVQNGDLIERKLTLGPGVRLEGTLDETVPRPVHNGTAVVSVLTESPTDKADLLYWQTSTEIAEDGTFAFESLPRGEGEIIAVCDGYVSESARKMGTTSRNIPQSVQITDAENSIEISMLAGATCTVTVATEDGNPVEGARVSFWPNVFWHDRLSQLFGAPTITIEEWIQSGSDLDKLAPLIEERTKHTRYAATTGADGTATVSTLLPGSESFNVEHDALELPAGGPAARRDARVELTSGKTTGVSVTVYPKASAPPTETAATPAACRIDGETGGFEVEPTPGVFSGTVLDEAGKPLEGVVVDAWTWHSGNETHTNSNGQFTLEGLGEHRDAIEVRFSKDGYSPYLVPYQTVGKLAGLIVLSNDTYLEGMVTDPKGEPVANALIRADQGPKQGPGVQITSIWTETRSNANGSYRLMVQDDTYDILVSDDRGNVARYPGVRIGKGDAKPLNIRLDPGVVFRAKVVDSETGEPVAGVRLWHWQHEGVEGTSGVNGDIEIAGMFPGPFEFNVESADHARWWSEQCISKWNRPTIDDEVTGWQRNFDDLDFDLEPDMDPVTIEVERGVRVSGTVVDPNGKPVAEATVDPARTGSGNSLTGDTRFSVGTEEDGTFEVLWPASKQAKYNLFAHDGKYGEWRNWANGVLDPIQTVPGQVIEDVTIALSEPGIVRGRVVDQQGQPVVDRKVRASATDKLENRYYDPTVRTDENGAFEIPFVRPGEHYIQVEPFWLYAEEAPEGTSQAATVRAGAVTEGVEVTTAPERRAEITPQPPEIPDPLAKVGELAPAFSGRTLDGATLSLADYKGKTVLLDFWSTWCGPCVSELPNLINAYEALRAEGLEIIGISLDSDRGALTKFIEENPGMKWPQIFDGKGWENSVATTYNVKAIPFTALVDKHGIVRATNLRGPGLTNAIEDVMNGTAPMPADGASNSPAGLSLNSTQDSEWKDEFYNLYGLDEVDIVKRIAPPFIPERAGYYRAEHRYQAIAIADPPAYFTFHWDGELKNWGLGFTSDLSLGAVLARNFGLKRYQFEGVDEVPDIDLPGDWILRLGTSDEDRLEALSAIMQRDLERTVHFERRMVRQKVVVARGQYSFHPEPNAYNDSSVHIFSDELDPDEGAGGGTGTLTEFLMHVGDRLLIPAIDETDGPKGLNLTWANHGSSALRGTESSEADAKRDRTLQNLAKQTGLDFTREEREVPVWFVSEKRANAASRSS
jgi:beta-lactamase regulating signal transducer with metallopeptidase domain/peroxiredoxin/uncharacterized GH25 family protein